MPSQQVICGNCGAKVPLPAGFAKARIRCGACGYYADVPPEMRSQPSDEPPASPPPARTPPPRDPDATPVPTRRAKRDAPDGPPPMPRSKPKPAKPAKARPRADPRDHRPEFEEAEGGGKPLLPGTQDEDDDQPYAVPGTGLKKCPECRGELPLDATFCVHCGTDFADGYRKKRSYQPVDETFTEGWATHVRLAVLGGAQVLNVILAVLSVIGATQNEKGIGVSDVVTAIGVNLFHAALQAFILGSYDVLRVQRFENGKCVMLRTRRVMFFPMKQEKVKWKSAATVGIVATHDAGIFPWVICIYLLGLACVPGVIFYFMVIRPERFNVCLGDQYGGVGDVVFRSKDRDQAKAIGELIADATGLKFKRVL